ncbi:MAG: putative Ig domain-containing protein [Planctomycetes bacterium]|nr:putative Ig domain-containing protein [Planctomycetota bacterium]
MRNSAIIAALFLVAFVTTFNYGGCGSSSGVSGSSVPADRPPVLTSPDDKNVNENTLLSFTLSASDPDGDTIAYSMVGTPTGSVLNPSTGAFSWTPSYTQSGSYPVTFTATANSLADSKPITIIVSNVNRPPVLAAVGNQTVNEAVLLTFTVSAADPDGDTITYSMAGTPTGSTLNSSSGVFSWTPGYAQTGNYNVTFRAEDVSGAFDDETITISVGDVNRPPVLAAIGNQAVNEGTTLTFTVSATDPDADTMTYSASGLPSGAVFTPTTGVFSWTPNYTQAGIYNSVTFTVTDSGAPNLADSETITISVNNTDRPPVLTAPGNQAVDENSNLLFTLSASDPDGDTIAYSMAGTPTGAALNAGTGDFAWMPDYTQAGDYVVTFTATSNSLSDSKAITILVNNINRTPVLAAIGNQAVNEGALLTFTVSATDPDNDTLTYSATGLPGGATLNSSTGAFSWMPNYIQSGDYNVTFRATDTGALFDEEAITITVTDVPGAVTLFVTNNGGGAVSSSPAGISGNASTSAGFIPGTVVTLTAVADANYGFIGWTGAYTGAGDCVLTMTADTSVTATFTPLIVVSLVPARTSGVAPLAVFFDASSTTAVATTRPFHDLEYRWDFGDPLGSPVSGTTWATGSNPGVNSRNEATGPVVAHVFERPGTYTINLTAFDGTNTAVANTTITVQDPDVIFAGTNTICIGATVTPTPGVDGCPDGAFTVMQPNFATAITTYATTGKRVLFRRGDTFTSTASGALTSNGPGIVGAFGAGASPIVRMTNNTVILALSNRSTPGIGDWRVMDLEFDGLSTLLSEGVRTQGGINQVTLLRLNMHDIHDGFGFTATILDSQNGNGYPGHKTYDQIAIVDSSVVRIVGTTGGVGFAGSGKHFAMLGNFGDDAILGEHVVRLFYLYKAVVSNNTLSRQASTKGVIKMHGPTWTPSTDYHTDPPPTGVEGETGGYTELVVLSDNKFVGMSNAVYTVNMAAQDSYKDERLRNIIVERNWWPKPIDITNSVVKALAVDADEVTIRNNICAISSGGFVLVRGTPGSPTDIITPPPTNVRVYNNTIYSNRPTSVGYFIAVDIRAPSTNVTVYNNLAYAPYVRTDSWATNMVIDAGTGTITAANSTNFQIKNTFPGWFSATPDVPTDFMLMGGSYAIGVGALVPVWSDFFRTPRPQGSMDMGAVKAP